MAVCPSIRDLLFAEHRACWEAALPTLLFPRFSWGLPRRLHERSRRFAAANPSCSRSALAFARSLCGQRGLQAPVQSKEVLDALALGHEARTAVETVDGAVQRVMCSSKIRRHQVGVVEIGQRRVRVSSAGVKHGLRKSLQCRQTFAFSLLKPGGVGKVLYTTPTE